MTSRSEYRLLLRQDNADARLTPIGYQVGLINEERYEKFLEKQNAIAKECERARKTVIAPTDEVNALLTLNSSATLKTGAKLAELIKRPELTYAMLSPIDKDRPKLPRAVAESAEILLKYEGYIARELAEAERHRKLEDKAIPKELDYNEIKGLRLEAAEKLNKIRPLNIGQASRISGVNPADVSVLLIYLNSNK
jgi:tRNA uridine 5-carboxymethylaminomethyl modification enzyme